jgi:hypothetical protein
VYVKKSPKMYVCSLAIYCRKLIRNWHRGKTNPNICSTFVIFNTLLKVNISHNGGKIAQSGHSARNSHFWLNGQWAGSIFPAISTPFRFTVFSRHIFYIQIYCFSTFFHLLKRSNGVVEKNLLNSNYFSLFFN